jgi:hypothetical protein
MEHAWREGANAVKSIHIPNLEAIYWDEGSDAVPLPKGAYSFTTAKNGQRFFNLCCPGCGTLAPLAIRPVLEGSPPSWTWDGNVETPTLNPSINHSGCWHGWLREGKFIPVP